MPININTVTFKMYNYQTDYRGYIVYAGTKQECFERLSLFHILNKYYTIPLADIEFEWCLFLFVTCFSLKLNLIIA